MAQQNLLAVKAAAIDGRSRSVFYRQTQLEKLHRALVLESSPIQDAIVADTGRPASEARLEFSLALRVLRDRYAELDATRDLEAEYRIAKGQNAADAREPYGIAIIRPVGHTLFYSTVAPLCAALTAGNCVILQVRGSGRYTTSMVCANRRSCSLTIPRNKFPRESSALSSPHLTPTPVRLSRNRYKTKISWPCLCKSYKTASLLAPQQ